jgi:TatD DNase family protein
MTVAANPGCAADRDASTEKHRQDWLCHKIQEFVFPMELIDSHAHIDFPQFAEDRDAMLERARAAGVSTLLAIGTGPGPEKLDAALPFAEQHDWIFATVGIHPHEAQEVTPQHLDQLAILAKHPKVIAWGEIGLDYFYDHSPRDIQDRVFRDQLALARQARLPIIIHCRDAWSDCLSVLEEVWRPAGFGGILHCFTSTLEDARRGLEMGFMISFAGNSTYPKAQNLRDVAKALPLENILIETDAPYLAPQGYRGKRNEPAYVGEVAKAIANVRNLRTQEVASATAANFRRFFGLMRPAESGVAESE